MNPNDQLNELGYASSAPDLINFDPPVTVKPEDENDITTIERMFNLLEVRDKFYDSHSAIVYGETITVENQLIINHQHRLLIQELRSLLQATIIKVKEKNYGR